MSLNKNNMNYSNEILSEWKPCQKKEVLQDEGNNTKFSWQRLPWISCKAIKMSMIQKFQRFRNVNITFSIIHVTTYDHVIKDSCNFVHGGPLS